MHQALRDRILRNLETLPEERLYQVLDYIEFLGSKYARDGVRGPASPFQRFTERLEDRLRLNQVAFSAIRGTMEVMGTADKVVNGLAEAGRSIVREVEEGMRPPQPAPPSVPRPSLPRQASGGTEEEGGASNIPVDG